MNSQRLLCSQKAGVFVLELFGIQICLRLLFGLEKSINNDLRLKIRVVWGIRNS